MDKYNGRMEMTEERVVHLENRSTEIIQSEEHTEKKTFFSKMNRTSETFRAILRGLRRSFRQPRSKKPGSRRMDLTAVWAQ